MLDRLDILSFWNNFWALIVYMKCMKDTTENLGLVSRQLILPGKKVKDMYMSQFVKLFSTNFRQEEIGEVC